jgi:hypothetical protein
MKCMGCEREHSARGLREYSEIYPETLRNTAVSVRDENSSTLEPTGAAVPVVDSQFVFYAPF